MSGRLRDATAPSARVNQRRLLSFELPENISYLAPLVFSANALLDAGVVKADILRLLLAKGAGRPVN